MNVSHLGIQNNTLFLMTGSTITLIDLSTF